ncbi:MAG: putative manganese-dependent inorganic diphosphatase [Lachnospiraceae bacterium]
MKYQQENKIWVIGHKNPDTDSICAAICYANLKNQLHDGYEYIPKRAGNINEETKYVLNFFGVEAPEYAEDAGAQAKDITFRKTGGVSSHISLRKAWELMKTENVMTLPVTNQSDKLVGLITTGDIAESYMGVYDNHILSRARTQYKNIVETLNGTLLAGNEHAYFLRGKVVVATGSNDLMEECIENDDLVIVGDTDESHICAIEENASCMVVTGGIQVSSQVLEMANRHDCVIISTPYDTFTTARLINQSIPIKYFMRQEGLVTFEIDDYVDEMKEVMSTKRHRDFPILDDKRRYLGMVSRRNLLKMHKKKLILVDHNEKSQAVNGIAGAEILEIIDHHRLGSLETMSPVFFRNQPLGCTSTIIYQMYLEAGIEIEEKIAGLLLSAILSDTLMFRSPTCTAVDQAAAEALAKIAGVDIEEHANKMFRAGCDFGSKEAEEIFYQDFKIFHADDVNFGVAQISAVSREELQGVKERIHDYMGKVLTDKKLDMVFVMLTDILNEETELLFEGERAAEIAECAYHLPMSEYSVVLKGVVSRKKQLIPSLIEALQQET